MEIKNNSLITSITPNLISGKNKHTSLTTAAIEHEHSDHPCNVNTGVSCKSGSVIDKVILYSWPPSFPVTSWEGFTNWSAMLASGAYRNRSALGDTGRWQRLIGMGHCNYSGNQPNGILLCYSTSKLQYHNNLLLVLLFFIQFWVVNSSILSMALSQRLPKLA